MQKLTSFTGGFISQHKVFVISRYTKAQNHPHGDFRGGTRPLQLLVGFHRQFNENRWFESLGMASSRGVKSGVL